MSALAIVEKILHVVTRRSSPRIAPVTMTRSPIFTCSCNEPQLPMRINDYAPAQRIFRSHRSVGAKRPPLPTVTRFPSMVPVCIS